MREDWQIESTAYHRCHLAIFLSTFQCQVARVWVVQAERTMPTEESNSMRWPKSQKWFLSLASLKFVVLKATILPETCNEGTKNIKHIVSRAYLKKVFDKVKSQKAMTFKKNICVPLIKHLSETDGEQKSIKMCLLWTLTWSHIWKIWNITVTKAENKSNIFSIYLQEGEWKFMFNHDNDFPQV